MENYIPFAEKTNKIYFTFGRFQPPHDGHELLIEKVKELAKENSADYLIFVSSSLNKPNWKTSKAKGMDKNPLPVQVKISFLEKMFPRTYFIDGSKYGNQILRFIDEMKNNGYTDITGVFGGVRADEFETLFKKYKPETKIVKVPRDEDNSISATKMRDAAFNNPGFFKKHSLIGKMTPEDVEELQSIVKEKLTFGKHSFGKRSFGKKMLRVLADIKYLSC